MTLYKQRTSDKWWFKIKWKGHETRHPTGTKNRRIASEIEAAYRLQLVRTAGGVIDVVTAPTLRELAPKFTAYYREHAKKESMIRFYDQNLAHLLAFEPLATAHLDVIDEQLVAKFIRHRRAGVRRVKPNGVAMVRPVTNSTINRALATLRRMLKLALRWRMIDRAVDIRLLPGERSREYVLDPQDEQRYFAECNPRLAKIAALSLLTSLRANECRTLRWTDVHLKGAGSVDRAFIRVRSAVAKSGKVRIVPLSAAALAFFQAQPRDGDLVLGKNFPLLTSIARSQARTVRRLGLPKDFVFHSLRHTALTRMGMSGMDAFTLKEIAGHASITTTQKYIHPMPEHVSTSMDRIDALARVAMMPKKTA